MRWIKNMQVRNIAFVVHRYYPFPGGSETTVRAMAETVASRGHNVTVWAPTNQGNQNGVFVTDDPNYLFNKDLIIMHGVGPGPQNFIAENLNKINSPLMYMIIKPEETPIHLKAAQGCKWVAASTLEDYEFVDRYNLRNKTINYRYGLLKSTIYGEKTFREKYNLPKDKTMFLSCGGYWAHKGMDELVNTFNSVKPDNAFLVTTGYHDINSKPKDSDVVFNLMLEDKKDVLNAMADANYYILNSYEEGFGLVLLESMFNKLPWIARNIAAAKMFNNKGLVYDNNDQLKEYLKNIKNYNFNIEDNYHYVQNNHTAEVMVDDLLKVLQ